MGYGSRALQLLQMYYEGKFPTVDESSEGGRGAITSVSSEVRLGIAEPPELQSGTGSLWWRAGRRHLVKQRQKLKGHRTNQSRRCSFREKPLVLLLECETLMNGITARIWSSRLDQSPQLPVSRPRLLPQ